MMMEAAKISSLGNDRQRIDRPDTRDLPQEMIILAISQQFVSLRLDLITLSDQAACFGDDHPEHANSRGIQRQRQSD